MDGEPSGGPPRRKLRTIGHDTAMRRRGQLLQKPVPHSNRTDVDLAGAPRWRAARDIVDRCSSEDASALTPGSALARQQTPCRIEETARGGTGIPISAGCSTSAGGPDQPVAAADLDQRFARLRGGGQAADQLRQGRGNEQRSSALISRPLIRRPPRLGAAVRTTGRRFVSLPASPPDAGSLGSIQPRR